MIEVFFASGASSFADSSQSASESGSNFRIPQLQPMLNLASTEPLRKHWSNAKPLSKTFQLTMDCPDIHYQLHTNVFL